MNRTTTDRWPWLSGGHALVCTLSRLQQHSRMSAWINTALDRGEKVYRLQRGGDLPGRLQVVYDRPGHPHRRLGQVEVVEVDEFRAATSGDPDQLLQLYLDLLERARRDNYNSVAFAGDAEAMHGITCGSAQLLVHEQNLQRLTAGRGVRALCGYDLWSIDSATAARLFDIHFRHVDDESWSCDLVEGQLVVRGQIDAENADRFAAALIAAAHQGITVVDLDGVDFIAAAGVESLARVAAHHARHGRRLHLVRVGRGPLMVLKLTGLTTHPNVLVDRSTPARPPGR